MVDVRVPSSAPRPPQEPLSFHQGYVLEWNALTGTNKVRVLGVELSNLLSLMGSEVGLIRAGDAVGILRFQTQYFVLGRVEASGVEQRALGVHYAETITLDDPVTDDFERRNGPEVTVDIGSTRRCFVSLSAEMLITNNVEWMGFRVTGASNIEPQEYRSLTAGGPEIYLQATRTLVLEAQHGLEEGSNTFSTMHRTSIVPGDVPLVGECQIIVQPF